ncbi:MAG: hypothetical protein P1V13_15990 [Rhizobiaceae bacterium]|nr:hypothetical protein [Rhizobiaceae bacterium]
MRILQTAKREPGCLNGKLPVRALLEGDCVPLRWKYIGHASFIPIPQTLLSAIVLLCGESTTRSRGSPLTTITTLADLQRESWQLTAHCQGRNCGGARKLDLVALIARFGPDHVFINDQKIPPLLVCRRCGHRGGSLTINV